MPLLGPPLLALPAALRHRSVRLGLACVLLAGCTGAGGPEPPVYRAEPSNDPIAARAIFWEAVERLDVAEAARHAPDEEHAAFARALALTLEGRMHEAEGGLREATRSAADSVLREVSRTTLVSVLTYQGDWGALHDLALDGGIRAEERLRDRAGVLAWSQVMRHAPEPRIPTLERSATVPMRTAATGSPMVTVRINGCTRNFWLDTGSSTTLVAGDVAEECGVTPLTTDTLQMITTTGRVNARPATIGALAIGTVSAADVPAAIVSQQELQLERLTSNGRIAGPPVRIDGVIGFDYLRRFDVELDFARRAVTFRPPGGLATRRAPRNFHWLGYPVVTLEDGRGRPYYFGLDTGADQSFGTPYLLDKLPRVFRGTERRRIAGFGSDTTETVPVVTFLQLHVGRRHLFFTGLVVRDQRRLLFLTVDGVLGADAGTAGSIRFDMASGRFIIEG
jgi:hypothetical protein